MILPKSLKEKQDRESYVSRLIDLTRTLSHEPKPTAENFTSITHSVCIVLDEWASGGRDTRPYKEEVEWVKLFYTFTQSMRYLPPDKDGICKEREYAIDGSEKKEIDEAMWDLYRDLEKIAFQFELMLTDARDPRVPLKRYGRGADLDQPWWWQPMFDSEVVYGEGLMTMVRLRTGVVRFCTEDLDDILHSFELLAADNAPPESDIRHEYDKFIQEFNMSKNGNVPKNGRYGGAAMGSDPMAKECANAINTPSAAPPTTHVVELSDESAKKVARLTGAEVKKFIKPGRGSKNTRFPDETKEACVRIWEKYKGNPEVKKRAQKRKVKHEDVFEYAKKELEKIGISSADEFKSALGAASDKKHRESPAVKEKKPQ